MIELAPGGPGLALPTALGTVVAPALNRGAERSPAMKAYAAKIFGGVELTEDQWKHCEIQLQVEIQLAHVNTHPLLDLPAWDLINSIICSDEYIDDL